MLEYMTYCRYFARRSSRFVHARLISASHADFEKIPRSRELRQEHIAIDPFVFSADAMRTPGQWDLPTLCNPWGVPHWGRISVGRPRQAEKFFLKDNYYPMAFKPMPKFEDGVIPFLFAGTPTEIGGAQLHAEQPEVFSLHWPLFRAMSGNLPIPDAVGKKPDLDAALQSFRDFIVAPETVRLLLDWCEDANMKRIVQQGCTEFQTQVHAAAVFNGVLEENAHKVLEAFEFFQGFRWAFQSPPAVKRWDEINTAVFILVNTLLSAAENPNPLPEKPMEFLEWFGKTFQTDKRLALCYARNSDGELDQGGRLCEQEFALIGLVNDPAPPSHITKDMLVDWLKKWQAQAADNPIRRIIGLKSSISDPWRHAEVSWIWGCEQGKPQLNEMVNIYCQALNKSIQITT